MFDKENIMIFDEKPNEVDINEHRLKPFTEGDAATEKEDQMRFLTCRLYEAGNTNPEGGVLTTEEESNSYFVDDEDSQIYPNDKSEISDSQTPQPQQPPQLH